MKRKWDEKYENSFRFFRFEINAKLSFSNQAKTGGERAGEHQSSFRARRLQIV